MALEKKILFLSFIVFCILTALGLFFHELWQDEAQPFLLARDSSTFSEMLNNCRFQGNPLLWNILLWCGVKIFPSIFIMKLINWMFVIGSAALILFRAPFKPVFRILICFNYFFIYEYACISRNNALFIFFILLALWAFSSEKKRLFFIAVFFLINSHFFGLIFSLAIFVYIICIPEKRKFFFGNLTEKSAVGILFLWSLFLLWFHYPPINYIQSQVNSNGIFTLAKIQSAFSGSFKAFFHIPMPEKNEGWNDNLLIRYSKWPVVPAAIIFFILPIWLLKKNKPVLFFWLTCLISITCFLFFSPVIPGLRHCGFLFIFFIAALWLLQERSSNFELQKHLKIFLFVILPVGVFSGAYMLAKDLLYPFSAAKELSSYIELNFKKEIPVFLSNHSSGPAVSVYLNRKIYYPERKSYGSFIEWDTHPFILQPSALNDELNNFSRRISDTGIVVFNIYYVENFLKDKLTRENEKYKLILMKQFRDSFVSSERYNIYIIVHKNKL